MTRSTGQGIEHARRKYKSERQTLVTSRQIIKMAVKQLIADTDGEYDFRREVSVYGDRARKLKEIFLRHGFHIVYDKDLDEPVADGFYFTIGYKGMTSGQLARELMYYGVSAICLITTGSHQEGLRVCTSFIEDHQYAQLEERMQIFEENNC